MNFFIVTLDCLRFDTTQIAKTPNFHSLFAKYSQMKDWVQVGAHGTYTLPSHIALFHDGRTPANNDPRLPGPYNRNKEILFRPELAWREKDATYPTPEAPNIVKGFDKLGYRTVGIGGVSWFSDRFETSDLWAKNYFQEFYWKPEYADNNMNNFENQIEKAKEILANHDQNVPLFFFINVASCHTPYMNNDPNVEGQARCLEYIDDNIMRVVNDLPKPVHVLFMADHGECFGEDGNWGHAIYHPKVLEIPMQSFIIPKEENN